MELGVLIQYIGEGRGELEVHPHVIIPLLGRFNNESGEGGHLFFSATETASYFRPRVWIERLLYMLLQEERTSGPVFFYEVGILVLTGAMNNQFILEIIKVTSEREDLVLCTSDTI